MTDHTTRRVPDEEEVSIYVLRDKYKQGALWIGRDEMNIGWPDELHISGSNVIRLLTNINHDLSAEIEQVTSALDQHKVPNADGLSQADRIHLLVGRMRR